MYPNLPNWSIRFAEGQAEKFFECSPLPEMHRKKVQRCRQEKFDVSKMVTSLCFLESFLSVGVFTIGEESNAVGLITNGITEKQRKSMTSVVFDHITQNDTHSHTIFWVCVSIPFGRALAWHARGQRFDPAILHQKSTVLRLKYGAFLFDSSKNRPKISRRMNGTPPFCRCLNAAPNF